MIKQIFTVSVSLIRRKSAVQCQNKQMKSWKKLFYLITNCCMKCTFFKIVCSLQPQNSSHQEFIQFSGWKKKKKKKKGKKWDVTKVYWCWIHFSTARSSFNAEFHARLSFCRIHHQMDRQRYVQFSVRCLAARYLIATS